MYDGGGGGGGLENKEATGEEADEPGGERGEFGPSDVGEEGPEDEERRDLDVNSFDSEGIASSCRRCDGELEGPAKAGSMVRVSERAHPSPTRRAS